MIVVADASPLNYLIQIECADVLQKLHDRVLVPPAVIEELRHARAPASVTAWLNRIPEWLEIRTTVTQNDPTLQSLDPGEREAIQLAEEQRAHLLLIDERKGRREASRRGIATTGTLGVLVSATRLGLLEGEAAYQRLVVETTFRSSPEVQATFVKLCKERKE